MLDTEIQAAAERFESACAKIALAMLSPLVPLCVWAFMTTPGAHL